MANHGHQPNVLHLLTVMMLRGWRLSFSNQNFSFLWNPPLIWLVDQIEYRLLLDSTDFSPLQCVASLVLQWNRNFLPRGRIVSGASSCCRCFLRLSTGACLLTQGYGGFIWVFDPGINRVLAANEDLINLVETKKNCQAQCVPYSDPVSLIVFVEDDDYYDSDLTVSHQKTDKSSALVRMFQRETIHKITDAKTRKFVMTYSLLIVIVTNKKSLSESSDLSMRCALWSYNNEMFLPYTFHISERPKMEKAIENYSGSTEKRSMDINQHQWVGRYRRHDPEPSQATYQSIHSIKVMRKAFRSFIYKMIACYECMKRGLNRFILLPVRLLLESRVTSTSSSKLGFNFLYLFQWLYLNGFM